MKLSDDYSPWGKYSTQILIISLSFITPGTGLAVIGLFSDTSSLRWIGIGYVFIGCVIFYLGMRKQDKELNRKRQK